MSRPSRGFSVPNARPASASSCPALVSFNVATDQPDDWSVDTIWTPAVTLTSITVEYQVNGGAFATAATLLNPSSPHSYDFHWADFAAEGDFIGIRVRLVGPGACGSIVSAVVTNQAEP